MDGNNQYMIRKLVLSTLDGCCDIVLICPVFLDDRSLEVRDDKTSGHYKGYLNLLSAKKIAVLLRLCVR